MQAVTSSAPTLHALRDELARRESEGASLSYHVPGKWAPLGAKSTSERRQVNPYTFLRDHVDAILAHAQPAPAADGSGGEWVARSTIYNMFVRLATAYDHDGDAHLGRMGAAGLDTEHATCNAQGVRETGTFLKSLALLGHMKRLGCDAVHLLPITAVGRFGNKGNLGSPYAIRNPYHLEETLRDPLLDANTDTQFKAFVEACHLLGMRVIVEFVFRTSSRDGDWVAEHPDWYYWIRRDIEDRPPGAAADDHRYYGVPPFDLDSLKMLKEKVANHDFHELPPPPEWYRGLFCKAPIKVDKELDGRYSASNADGIKVHVPSAFADWPPDDYQPPWTDVTYLRVYNDPPSGPSFNYIAYNTIRMYDDRLAQPDNANRPLWDAIRGIIPHYQKQFGIDGVMVDMGHALPPALMSGIIEEARRHHPDFALLSENFSIEEDSRKTGYNAVLGYQFRAVETAEQMRNLIERSCAEGLPIAAFGTGETHNTPRAAMRGRGARFCRSLWLINNFLADTIPFIHAGFEVAEEHPVNLGLAFTPQELQEYGKQTLALFDASALHWEGAPDLADDLAAISGWRKKYASVSSARGKNSLKWVNTDREEVLAFVRIGRDGKKLLFVINWSEKAGPVELIVNDEFTGMLADPDELMDPFGWMGKNLRVDLEPWEGQMWALAAGVSPTANEGR